MVDTNKQNVVEELTRPIIKLLLALIGLFIIRFIVVRLPGLEASAPGLPITFSTLAGSLITLVMIGIIVNFGREVEPRIEKVVNGPVEIVRDLSESMKLAVFLIAIFIAYDGLSSALVPFLIPDPGRWTYDVVFLLIALVPTVLIAQKLFGNLDEVTDILTKQIKSATVDEIDCPSCSSTVRGSLDFCPECGEDIAHLPAEKEETEATTDSSSVCSECGADIDADAAFCGSCGTPIQSGSD